MNNPAARGSYRVSPAHTRGERENRSSHKKEGKTEMTGNATILTIDEVQGRIAAELTRYIAPIVEGYSMDGYRTGYAKALDEWDGIDRREFGRMVADLWDDAYSQISELDFDLASEPLNVSSLPELVALREKEGLQFDYLIDGLTGLTVTLRGGDWPVGELYVETPCGTGCRVECERNPWCDGITCGMTGEQLLAELTGPVARTLAEAYLDLLDEDDEEEEV